MPSSRHTLGDVSNNAWPRRQQQLPPAAAAAAAVHPPGGSGARCVQPLPAPPSQQQQQRQAPCPGSTNSRSSHLSLNCFLPAREGGVARHGAMAGNDAAMMAVTAPPALGFSFCLPQQARRAPSTSGASTPDFASTPAMPAQAAAAISRSSSCTPPHGLSGGGVSIGGGAAQPGTGQQQGSLLSLGRFPCAGSGIMVSPLPEGCYISSSPSLGGASVARGEQAEASGDDEYDDLIIPGEEALGSIDTRYPNSQIPRGYCTSLGARYRFHPTPCHLQHS